jgi:hypothetical protein
MTADEAIDHMKTPIGHLEAACEAVGRDPSTVTRTMDMYSITPPGFDPPDGRANTAFGSAEELAEHILRMGEIGVSEVRLDLTDTNMEAVEAMGPVVDLVRAS